MLYNAKYFSVSGTRTRRGGSHEHLTLDRPSARLLLESWNDDGALRQAAWQTLGAIRAHLATVLIAAATVAAGGVLAVVGLHMLAN